MQAANELALQCVMKCFRNSVLQRAARCDRLCTKSGGGRHMRQPQSPRTKVKWYHKPVRSAAARTDDSNHVAVSGKLSTAFTLGACVFRAAKLPAVQRALAFKCSDPPVLFADTHSLGGIEIFLPGSGTILQPQRLPFSFQNQVQHTGAV